MLSKVTSDGLSEANWQDFFFFQTSPNYSMIHNRSAKQYIQNAPEIELKLEAQMEIYEAILEQGCFYCQNQDSNMVDYSDDHKCIDVCQ